MNEARVADPLDELYQEADEQLRAMLKRAEDDLARLAESGGDEGYQDEDGAGAGLEDLIAQVRFALDRHERRIWHKCCLCSSDIGAERLRSLPHVGFCLDCVKSNRPELAERRPWVPQTGEDGDAQGSPGAADVTPGPAASGDKTFGDLSLPEINRRTDGSRRAIPVDAITASPANPRRDPGDVDGLATSIASVGLLSPLVVVEREDGDFELVTGHRRLAAVRSLGWDVVTADVWNLGDKEVHLARMIENVQREDLHPVEEARGYRRLVEDFGLSQRELADRIGRSQAHISKRLALLELPDNLLDRVGAERDSGGITLEEAQELLRLREHDKAFKEIANELAVELDDYAAGVAQEKEDAESVAKDKGGFQRYAPYRPDVHSGVAQAVETVERERKRAEAEKKLKEKGVKVVKRLPLDNPNYARIGKAYNQIDVSRKKHEAESCHIAYFESPYAKSAVAACTDKRRHAPKGDSELKAKEPERQQQLGGVARRSEEDQARTEAIAAATKARNEFAARLIEKGVELDEAVALYLAPLTNDKSPGWMGACLYELSARDVAQRLGLKKASAGDTGELSDYISKGKANRARTVLAAAVHNTEWELDDAFDDGEVQEQYRAYFDFLARHGYELSDVERELIEDSDGQTDQDEGKDEGE